jgi:hypothetical protein
MRQRMISRKCTLAVFTALLTLLTFQARADEAFYEEMLGKAIAAFESNDEVTAAFYSAKYLGVTMRDENTDHGPDHLISYLAGRATSFTTLDYDQGFLRFFFYENWRMWGIHPTEMRKKKLSVPLFGTTYGNMIVEIWGYPRIENWLLIGKNNKSAALLTSKSMTAFLVELDSQKKEKMRWEFQIEANVQYLWYPELYDVDSDGRKELLVRYNHAKGSGFSQILDIYSIKEDGSHSLMKRFNGDAEGIARRVGDQFEVAHSFARHEDLGHLSWDKHRVERWEFKGAEFVKVSEKVIPHILRSEAWEAYYYGD